jgi:hypothetical protein
MIYHITHVDNLPQMIADGELLSDAAMQRRGGPTAAIGLAGIKSRRLALPVRCHPGDMVGEYVPFYFCPRSVMLYIIHMANYQELTYRGGQGPIVHLEASLHDVVAWAESVGRRWAFSLSNAGAAYTEFRAGLHSLSDVNWKAVQARDWRDADIKEGKQAEFLLYHSSPWALVSRIGVETWALKTQVDALLANCDAIPQTEVRPDWYY